MPESNWNAPGAALSDNSAIKEYGLTQEEIYAAVRAGKLQYREASAHGNPYLRLLRSEVESHFKQTRGEVALAQQKLQTELKSFQTQIRSCKIKLKKLENRRDELQAELA